MTIKLFTSHSLCLWLALLTTTGASLHAFKYEWGGTIRLDTGFDTRQNVGTDDGATILFPYPPEYDSNCCDINAHEHFGMTPAITNVFFKTSDYHIKKCELRSYFESDFTGNAYETIGIFKIRHAFLKAIWPTTSLLVGQYFHPTAVEECAPNNVNFNGGMPIACYARWPQIRLKHMWRELIVSATIYSQFLFASPGPDWYSSKYMRASLTPGLCLTLGWTHNKLSTGVLFNVKRLKPSQYTSPNTDSTKKYVTEALITSSMASAWLGFNIGHLRWNNQCTVGQNGPDFNTLGGYAVSTYNQCTGHCTYTNIGFAGIWTDLEYDRYQTCTPGLFAGVVKSLPSRNLVYIDPLTHEPIFYGFYSQLDKVVRIAPRLTTTVHNIFVGVEVDYANAWFGPMNRKGEHLSTQPTGSTRFLLSIQYNF